MTSAIPRVAQKIPLGEPLTLAGLNDSAKAFLIGTQAPFQKKVILWFVESDEKTEELYHNLRFWQRMQRADWQLQRLPSVKEQKISGELISRNRRSEQLFLYHLARRTPGIYLVPIQMVGSKVTPPHYFQEDLFVLHLDDRISREEVLRRLINHHYESDKKVFEPGVVAARGSVVDLWPLTSDVPYRLEWEGEQIISMASFDPATSKRGKKVSEITIVPVASDQRSLLWEHFGNEPLIIYDNVEHLKANFNIFSLAENERAFAQFSQRFTNNPQLNFELFPSLDNPNQVVFDFQNPASYRGNLDFFLQDLGKFTSEDYTIWIKTRDPKAIQNLAHKSKVNLGAVTFVDEKMIPRDEQQAITADVFGFVGRRQRIAFFTDKEIFGIEHIFKNGTSRFNAKNATTVSELKPGDFIVHVDHGIGRFLGTQTNVIDEIPREYFVLEYAENDRLYLPVEFAEKISKYIGRENPTINKLGGASWNQTKRVVQKKAQILAGDLLKLYALRASIKSPVFSAQPAIEEAFSERFDYDLTPDQAQAVSEILADMERDTPMDRLLVGDVGFGKTEVAMRAAVRAAANGYQVVFLAPTTILVDQHYENFCERFKGLPVKVAALSRFRDKKEIAEVVRELATGEVHVVIGTHRLLSRDIKFKKPGLLIIDEEQRFGVKQKEKIKAMRNNMHVLALSATPIPRTLNMSLAGLRDFSVIMTPPIGRLPIETYIEPYSDEMIDKAIGDELKRGGQVYVLHNRIETIGAVRNRLQQKFPTFPAAVAHGQMEEDQLETIMDTFYDGTTKILVCSTIIENGIDLPSVNTLIVDRADQFGLAQLYQLRGRIGRGSQKAYAYFLYRNRRLAPEAKDRLQALLESTELGSGFKLAMRDLEIRGAGNILGPEQSGNIAAVGLNLYLRLLNQAVAELKSGKQVAPVLDVTIDLPIAAYLPQDFFEDEQERLQTYQILAQVETFAELDQFKETVGKNRFHIPTPMKNLMEVLELKLLMQQARILAAKTVRGLTDSGSEQRRILLEFAEPLDPQAIEKLLARNPKWYFTTQLIKIGLDDLGTNWLQEIKETVRLFAKKHPTPHKKSDDSSIGR